MLAFLKVQVVFKYFFNILLVTLLAFNVPGFASETALDAQFSVSLGYGKISSPFLNTNDKNLVVLPKWSIYYDRLYLENADFGIVLIENKDFNIDLVGEMNFDAMWFDQNSLRYSLFRGLSNMGEISIGQDSELNPEVLSQFLNEAINPNDRHYSYLIGSRYDHHFNDFALTLSWMTDASNVHNGNQLRISLEHILFDSNFKLSIKAETRKLSDSFSNYYYGTLREESITNYQYQPQSFWLPKVTLNSAFIFDEKWSLNALILSERYPRKINKNGFTEDRYNLVWFLGIKYRW